MSERIFARVFHAAEGAEAWRVLPDGAYAFFRSSARVAAGLAAGGRMVRYNEDELFWTLADPAGNEIDIGTSSAPDPVS